MLIIKGKTMKSVLAQIIVEHTNSICIEYYNYPVMYNSYCVNSEEYSLSDFIEFVSDLFEELKVDYKYYEYLIIYTNEKEEDLKPLIDWLNEHRFEIFCVDILVMCKE